MTLPWYRLSPLGEAFHAAATEAGWVIAGFDWGTWSQTAGAQRFLRDPGAVRAATVADMEGLLTTLIRKERFAEGTLAWAHETGLLRVIAERAEALAAGTEPKG